METIHKIVTLENTQRTIINKSVQILVFSDNQEEKLYWQSNRTSFTKQRPKKYIHASITTGNRHKTLYT